jgi:hypothetical protein
MPNEASVKQPAQGNSALQNIRVRLPLDEHMVVQIAAALFGEYTKAIYRTCGCILNRHGGFAFHFLR